MLKTANPRTLRQAADSHSQCATRVVLSLVLLIGVQSAFAQSRTPAAKAASPRVQEGMFIAIRNGGFLFSIFFTDGLATIRIG